MAIETAIATDNWMKLSLTSAQRASFYMNSSAGEGSYAVLLLLINDCIEPRSRIGKCDQCTPVFPSFSSSAILSSTNDGLLTSKHLGRLNQL